MADTVNIKVWIRTNKVGSDCQTEIEFDRDEWESMSEKDRDDACQDAAFYYLDWGWKEA